MTPCPDATTLQQFLDGALDPEANQAIDAHLESCHACQQKLEEAVRLPDAWRALLAQTGDYGEAAEATTAVNAARSVSAPRSEAPAIPGYEVEEELGRGGMGVVYRARDVRLRRDVAIKVLAENLAEVPQAVQRFMEEAHIAAQLQHPGIAAVHELGVLADGRPFLAMKLVKGQTLAALLRQRSSPQEERTPLLSIFGQVCQAVAYAHSKGVIHRDLKPGNIMVGAFGEVQVMDWGLAKVLSQGEGVCGEQEEVKAGTVIDTPREDRSTWRTQGVVGTYAYMAPEQARGQSQRVDRRSDVFALGAILGEILSGKPPYSGGSSASIRQQAEDADLAETLSRLQGCGADAPLVELTWTCLACKPEERPADASEVAQAVAAYQAQVQERLRRAELERAEAEVREAEGRKRRRLHAGLAVAALLAMLLATGGGWLWHQRQVELRGDVEAALAAAAEHRDGARWMQARRSLDYAEERLGVGGPAKLQQALAQERADMELTRKLDDIRVGKTTLVEGKFMNQAVASRAYEQVFRAAALGVLDEDPAALAPRIRGSAIRAHLLAALDDWAAGTTEPERQAKLLAVARLADDPRYARFRDARVWANPQAVEQLAREALDANTPASLVIAMAQRPSRVPLALLQAAVARHPRDFYGHFHLANELWRIKGVPQEAVGHYWAALAIRPDSTGAYTNLGFALQKAKDVKGAIAALRQAAACDPTGAAAHSNLGAALYDSGDVQGAIAAFRQAIACNPRYAFAHTNLGNALHKSGDVKGSIAAQRQAIACDPKLALAHNNLALALQESGDVKGAIAAYRQAIACDSACAQAHTNLGAALYDSGDLKGAIAAHRQAIACDPRHADAHTNLGNALHASGDQEGAIAAHRQAIACDSRHRRAHYNLGIVLYAIGDRKGAIAAYRDAIACDPTYPHAHHNLGLALQESGDVKGALAAYRQAIACDPRDAKTLCSLATALHQSRDVKGAIAAYRQSIQCEPRDAKAHYNLGIALQESEDVDGAMAAYRQAIECNPRYPQAHCNLGLLLQRQGKFVDALVHLKRGHELGHQQRSWSYPSGSWVAQCERLLSLDQRLTAVVTGKRRPGNAAELLALAELCDRYKQMPVTAARFYRDAFAARAALADDQRQPHRYNAACVAVLAAAGQGNDAGLLSAAERRHWRRQAHVWLVADLAVWNAGIANGSPQYRQNAAKTLSHWQKDADLASVRDPEMLSWLPLDEAFAWCQLWAEVDRLVRRLQDSKEGPP